MPRWLVSVMATVLVAAFAGVIRISTMMYDIGATQRAVMHRVSRVEARQDVQEARIQDESREAEEDLKEHRKLEHIK